MSTATRRRLPGRPSTVATTGRGRLSVVGKILLGLWLLIMVLPLLWMLLTSLAPSEYLFGSPFGAVQHGLTFNNYLRVLGLAPTVGKPINFLGYLGNSLIYTTAVVLGQTVFSTMAGYAFARLYFRGREGLFDLVLTGMMLPPILVVLPNFMLMRQLGLVNTFVGLVAPTFFMTPFAIFFMRQFLLSVPLELEEAAVLDGCSRWQTFARVVVPAVRGPILTLAIVTAVGCWNDYLWPLLIGNDEAHKTLNVGLSAFLAQTRYTRPDWGALMAGSVLSVLPVLALLIVFGRRLVQSLSFTGIK